MDIDAKERLARIGDTSHEAIAARLVAARRLTGLAQKDFAARVGVKTTTYNSQEKKGAPTIEVMRFLYRNHRVDFNFIIHGDFAQLPGDVQEELFSVLLCLSRSGDQKPD